MAINSTGTFSSSMRGTCASLEPCTQYSGFFLYSLFVDAMDSIFSHMLQASDDIALGIAEDVFSSNGKSADGDPRNGEGCRYPPSLLIFSSTASASHSCCVLPDFLAAAARAALSRGKNVTDPPAACRRLR